MNTQPNAIHEMADQLHSASQRMRKYANELSESGDFDIVSDAINEVRSLYGSLRLDLLVTRPIREFTRHGDANV